MRYYFQNHAPCVATGPVNGEEITEKQYNSLLSAIASFDKVAPDGKYYQLQIDSTWILLDLPPVPPPEPMTEDEQKARAYDILMGGAE